jgi:hypothetical protein
VTHAEAAVLDRADLPGSVLDSDLMRAGACAILARFPAAALCAQLLGEARAQLRRAVASNVGACDGEEWRGGSPARRFVSAPGGSAQADWYGAPETTRILSQLCNARVVPTGGAGTYTYYARAGDHIALHRDIRTCDLATITCLLDRAHGGGTGGLVRCYPERLYEPLSRVRASPERGAVDLRIPVGSTLVLLGGLVPHRVLPTAAGELRVVSILCFRIAEHDAVDATSPPLA